jgi:acyl dehydratase
MYEQLEINTSYKTSTEKITLEEILEFAARYDPQYMHVDPVENH